MMPGPENHKKKHTERLNNNNVLASTNGDSNLGETAVNATSLAFTHMPSHNSEDFEIDDQVVPDVFPQDASLPSLGVDITRRTPSPNHNPAFNHVMHDSEPAPIANGSPLPPPVQEATNLDESLGQYPVCDVTNLRTTVAENGDFFTLCVYVAALEQKSVSVDFRPMSVVIRFKTKDPAFLREHPDASPDAVFQWSTHLKGTLDVSQCAHKVSSSLIELTLRKETPGSWIGNTPAEEAVSAPKVPKDGLKKRVPLSTKESANNNANQVTIKPEESAAASMAVVAVQEDDNNARRRGYTGLDNIGNTCFMNSVVQCLANTVELRDYFLESTFQKEINEKNPLGMQGRLAVAFAVLLRQLWDGSRDSVAPTKIKHLMSSKNSQFSGFAQHDAQELMAFLLDGLHEDLNRVKNKPYTNTVESDGRSDDAVAEEAWKTYKARNDSIIVDLFQGQYKSTLVCPACNKVSVTFDPFLYLSLPLPQQRKTFSAVMFWRDSDKQPTKVTVNVPADGKCDAIIADIAAKCGLHPSAVKVGELDKSNFKRMLGNHTPISSINSNITLLAFEVLTRDDDSMDTGEDIYYITVVQRILVPAMPVHCAECKKATPANGLKLKRCTKCYKVAYCDKNCQRAHWSYHEASCRRTPELVGLPFIISMRESEATYSNICNTMLSYAKHSVDYQQVHETNGNEVEDTLFKTDLATSVDSMESELGCSEVGQATGTTVSQVFYIKPVLQTGLSAPGRDRLTDKGTEVINLSEYPYLAMDWRNNERAETYCLVSPKRSLDWTTNYNSTPLFNSRASCTLEDCLQSFAQPETLSPEEAWYCPRCKTHREATKQLALWRLPRVLIVQLKRFSFKNLLFRDKIDKLVEFPLKGLDLAPYVGDSCSINTSTVYDLYGVVNHYGGMLGGHYTAYGRCASQVGWRCMDDSHVQDISEQSIVKSSAYLLFYRQRTDVPLYPPSASLNYCPTSAEAAPDPDHEIVDDRSPEFTSPEDLD